eukprot:GHVU01061623.1.p1 GENE.GHVU01061623.1~~GHVU01061623.1.p1  ORF type:complete len:364 (-),score=105.34 GHVU01061623.1:553-1644(-)
MGDKRTASQIYWGQPEPPTAEGGGEPVAKEEEEELVTKPGKLDLGNCTPYIVAPGRWSKKEINLHAKHLVMAMVLNGGQTCAHPQVIVTCKKWPQREKFLEAIRTHLKAVPVIGAFYPNAKARLAEMREMIEGEKVGDEADTYTVPVAAPLFGGPALAGEGDDPKAVVFSTDMRKNCAFATQETFCPAAAEVPLETAPTLAAFLPEAVAYANDSLYGNLVVTVIAKTSSSADKKAVEAALEGLRYGAVGLNMNGMNAMVHPALVWGAYGGDPFTTREMRSGTGHLGNANGYSDVLKAVLRQKFNSDTLKYQSVHTKDAVKMCVTFKKVISYLCERRGAKAGAVADFKCKLDIISAKNSTILDV